MHRLPMEVLPFCTRRRCVRPSVGRPGGYHCQSPHGWPTLALRQGKPTTDDEPAISRPTHCELAGGRHLHPGADPDLQARGRAGHFGGASRSGRAASAAADRSPLSGASGQPVIQVAATVSITFSREEGGSAMTDLRNQPREKGAIFRGKLCQQSVWSLTSGQDSVDGVLLRPFRINWKF
jgi:hypothetical protein